MTDWTKLVAGVAMMLPMTAAFFLITWRDAKQKGATFSDYVKKELIFAVGVLLLFGLPLMWGMGGWLIVEALR